MFSTFSATSRNRSNRSLSIFSAIAVAAGCLVASASASAADSYPSRPLTLIVPTAAGGPVDIAARIVAAQATKILGQQLIVENRPGANQKIGMQTMLRAPKDGYTLAAVSPASLTIGPVIDKDLGYDPQKDLTLLTCAIDIPTVLVVPPSFPAHTMKEFVAYARANPTKISYGSGGAGTSLNFSTEGLLVKLGIKALQVPYNSSGPAFAGLLGGQISLLMPDVAAAKGQIDAGKLTALAVTGNKRAEFLPNVPTLQESGVPELKDFSYKTWVGFVMSASVPKDVSDKLRTSLIAALHTPEVNEAFKRIGFVVVASSAKDFGAQLKGEVDINRKLVATGVVKVDQ
jgi:tripartite-type tricarboxylate transporter receptor subunit TctC